MYAARQIFIFSGNLVSTAAPVAPLVTAGASSATDSNLVPPVLPPRTPSGKNNDPIYVASASPTKKKRVFKATAKTRMVKGKKRPRREPSSSPTSLSQPEEPAGPATSSNRWPDAIIITDSEDETTMAIPLSLTQAPTVAAPAPPVGSSVGRLPSSDQEAPRTPRLPIRRRGVRRTGTRVPRRARREASPRFSPPDDMFLSDSPPKNQPTPTSTTAPINIQPPAVVDMYDDMFDSDSSDELPLSIFRTTARTIAPVVPPTVDSNAGPGNDPVPSQNTSNTPSSNRATRGLLSPVTFSSQPSNQVLNTPSTSRLLSANDRTYTYTPLRFPSSPLPSRTPQGFSPSGPAYPTGVIQHHHLNDDEFGLFLERALSSPRRR